MPPRIKRTGALIPNDAPRSSHSVPAASNRSIFTHIDRYDDDSAFHPALHAPTNQGHQTTEDVSVVDVNDSSEGDEWEHEPVSEPEPEPEPFHCKICIPKGKKRKTDGEGSETALKETPLKCGICFNATTEGGTQHPHVLKCGHIFGLDCILLWLEAKMPSTCPCCVKATHDRELIHLYVTSTRDEKLEDALEKVDDVSELNKKHKAEKAKLIGLNTLLCKCVKTFSETLAKDGAA